ncbi:RidA family protein [Larkinella harenae]
MIQSVETPNAPLPAGHYVQATVWSDLIFVSGQLPIHPITKEKKTGSIEDQTHQVLENLEAILKAAGSDLSHVLKTTVYIADITLWDQVNAIYADFFGDHKPARAVVPTNKLHYGFLIEIEAIAVRKAQ